MEVVSDLFMIALIIGSSSCMHTFNSQVGSGSNTHNLFGEDTVMWSISCCVVGENETSYVDMSLVLVVVVISVFQLEDK